MKIFDYESYNNVLHFVYNKMMTNIKSDLANELRDMKVREVNDKKTKLGKASHNLKEDAEDFTAWVKLFQNSKTNARWDLKPELKKSGYFHSVRIPESFGTHQKGYLFYYTPILGDDEYIYYFDMWSNIHFGYVARSIEFESKTLFEGNTGHNMISGIFGDASYDDNYGVLIGIALFNIYGEDLSISDMHAAIFEGRLNFNEDTTRVRPRKLHLSD